MTRETFVALVLFPVGALALLTLQPQLVMLSGILGLVFLYSQARILAANKGIPAWREPLVVPLVVATGLAEGGGLWLLLTVASGPAITLPWAVTGLALLARWALWLAWRNRLRAAPRALAAIDSAGRVFKSAMLLPLVAAALALASPLPPGALAALQALAGALALAGGLWFKFTLVTRGAYNQGFALTRLPVRGVR